MEKLMSIFEGLNFGNIADKLPSAESMMNGLTGWVRLLVLIGPLLMLGFGIFYMFFAPKEANHALGYRFFYAMSCVKVWQYTQRLAGIAYTALGGLLLIIMGLISIRFGRLAAPDLVWLAVKCVIWEAVLAIVATLAVDIVIVILYDFKGAPRKSGKATVKKKRPTQRNAARNPK